MPSADVGFSGGSERRQSLDAHIICFAGTGQIVYNAGGSCVQLSQLSAVLNNYCSIGQKLLLLSTIYICSAHAVKSDYWRPRP